MDENEIDFLEEIKVNKYKLDDECERHPSLYFQFSSLLDEAKNKYYKEQEVLKYLLGSKELHYRKNPPEDMKITDSTIKALLLDDKDIQKQEERIRELRVEMNLYETALNAVEHRKSMLNNLVKLYGSGYFSKPDTHAKNDKTDSVQAEMRSNLKRRKESDE